MEATARHIVPPRVHAVPLATAHDLVLLRIQLPLGVTGTGLDWTGPLLEQNAAAAPSPHTIVE